MYLRRTAHFAMLFCALSLAAVAGCSSGSTSGTEAGTPHSGGSITYATDEEPDCWDPHTSPQDVTAFLQRPIYDSLVYQTPDGSLEPWLATRWRLSKDGKVYTFELRKDVTFHDGSRLDAPAVKANFDHITAKKTMSQYAAGLLGPYVRTTVKGPYEVAVEFSRPYAPFLQAASTTYLGIASPASLRLGAQKLCAATGSVGSGPFKAGPYVRGQQRVYVKNPAYHWAPKGMGHSGPAWLDSFRVRLIQDDSTRVGALTSGQVDAAGAIPANQRVMVRRNSRLGTLSQQVPGAVDAFFLNTKSPVFSDERVREAFQRALDLDSIVKSVFQGTTVRAWSILSPSTPDSYDRSLERSWPVDRGLANRLLDEAGWTGRDSQGYRTKDGKRLTVTMPVYGKTSLFSQAAQGDLKKVGIFLDIAASTDVAEVSGRLDQGRYDVVESAWGRADGDILSQFFLSTETSVGSGHNFAHVADPRVDRWLKTAQTSRSPKVREQNYAKVQKAVIDRADVVPAYVTTSTVGYNNRVHGLRLGIDAWPEFYDAWVEGGR
jgi:peptide/nickel transport system substrate-binding protein